MKFNAKVYFKGNPHPLELCVMAGNLDAATKVAMDRYPSCVRIEWECETIGKGGKPPYQAGRASW